MDYTNLIGIITRNTGCHRFIEFKGADRQEVFDLLKKQPNAIFLEGDFCIEKKDCTGRQKDSLLNGYYKYLIACKLVENLGAEDAFAKPILETFRFGQKLSSVNELLSALNGDIAGLKRAYLDEETSSGYETKIGFPDFSGLFNHIEFSSKIKPFCNLYVDASNIGPQTAAILNNYIVKRMGGLLCFNICLDSVKEYPSRQDRGGNLIQDPHDFNTIIANKYIKEDQQSNIE